MSNIDISKVKNVLIDNAGDAVDLNSIRNFSSFKLVGNQFEMDFEYNNGDLASLVIPVYDYPESEDELLIKLNKIRLDILKRWRRTTIENDNEPFSPFSGINLKKTVEESN